MATNWAAANGKEINNTFCEFRRFLRAEHPVLVKTASFEIGYRGMRREVREIVLKMSDHLDFTHDFLTRACLFLLDCSRGHADPKRAIALLSEVNNYFSSPLKYADPLEIWPDGPGTCEGVCWICATEGNVQWLADPIEEEPRDRNPWCQKCYRARRRKES